MARRKIIGFRVDDSLNRALEAEARRIGVSVSEVLRNAMVDRLERTAKRRRAESNDPVEALIS